MTSNGREHPLLCSLQSVWPLTYVLLSLTRMVLLKPFVPAVRRQQFLPSTVTESGRRFCRKKGCSAPLEPRTASFQHPEKKISIFGTRFSDRADWLDFRRQHAVPSLHCT